MHPSVLLELNKFVLGSPNTLLQRLPLGPIPYYVYAAKHRQGQGLTLGPEANWHIWLMLILGIPQQHTALGPGFPQAPRVPGHHTVILCVSVQSA